ncbi:hypothetical protein OROMI_007087 [Orobanche minor]
MCSKRRESKLYADEYSSFSTTFMHGVRWKVGSGSDISVWQQPWLAEDGNMPLITACPEGYGNMRVSELFDADTDTWDVEQLEHFFVPHNVVRILRTPIALGVVNDRPVWHREK